MLAPWGSFHEQPHAGPVRRTSTPRPDAITLPRHHLIHSICSSFGGFTRRIGKHSGCLAWRGADRRQRRPAATEVATMRPPRDEWRCCRQASAADVEAWVFLLVFFRRWPRRSENQEARLRRRRLQCERGRGGAGLRARILPAASKEVRDWEARLSATTSPVQANLHRREVKVWQPLALAWAWLRGNGPLPRSQLARLSGRWSRGAWLRSKTGNQTAC